LVQIDYESDAIRLDKQFLKSLSKKCDLTIETIFMIFK